VRKGNSPKVAIVFSPHYDVSIWGIERLYHFDIHKYKRIHDALVAESLIAEKDVARPREATREDLLLIHTAEYLDSLSNPAIMAFYLEFPMAAFFPKHVIENKVLRTFRYCTGGTILAGGKALECGIGINLGGGYHHAKPDSGGGFCVYADVAIAIRRLQADGAIRCAVIIDLDLHQGDGNAVAFRGDDSVFTFSMHEEANYPIPKAKSDLDVGLRTGIGDDEYLALLERHLPPVIEKSAPDIAFYLAGTDVYEGDTLGGLKLTDEGIFRRDMFVVEEVTSRGIPLAMVLAGGYSDRSWQLHLNSIREMIRKYGTCGKETSGGKADK